MPDVRTWLAGAHEIRMLLGGLSRQRVHQITSHSGFPQPVAVLGQGKVWLHDDVERWIRVNRPDDHDRNRASPG